MNRKLYHKSLDDSGFMLIETIISILILFLVSGFILQMFIVSSQANERAKNIDFASAEIITSLELFKSSKNYYDLRVNGFMDNFSYFDDDTSFENYYKWYDEDWNILVSNDSVFNKSIYMIETSIEGIEYPMDARYVLIHTVKKSSSIYSDSIDSFSTSDNSIVISNSCSKYILTVTALDLYAQQDKKELVTYETTKYYSR